MISYGICLQSVVPVRKSPGDKSEMVNQLLFGDLIFVKDEVENWYLIEGKDDHYEGWTDKKQIRLLSRETFDELSSAPRFFIEEIVTECIQQPDQTLVWLLMGSEIHGLKENSFNIGDNTYTVAGSDYTKQGQPKREKIVETALKYLNAPYLWGGRSPFGIDCSGFTQIVFKICGFQLPRDASQQVSLGKSVDFIHEAQPGNLAFFGNDEGNIIHVGIILENQKIIHASGKIRIDKIDHNGIYNEEKNRYTHHLRIVKSIF